MLSNIISLSRHVSSLKFAYNCLVKRNWNPVFENEEEEYEHCRNRDDLYLFVKYIFYTVWFFLVTVGFTFLGIIELHPDYCLNDWVNNPIAAVGPIAANMLMIFFTLLIRLKKDDMKIYPNVKSYLSYLLNVFYCLGMCYLISTAWKKFSWNLFIAFISIHTFFIILDKMDSIFFPCNPYSMKWFKLKQRARRNRGIIEILESRAEEIVIKNIGMSKWSSSGHSLGRDATDVCTFRLPENVFLKPGESATFVPAGAVSKIICEVPIPGYKNFGMDKKDIVETWLIDENVGLSIAEMDEHFVLPCEEDKWTNDVYELQTSNGIKTVSLLD